MPLFVWTWVIFLVIAMWFVISFHRERKVYSNAILLGVCTLSFLLALLTTVSHLLDAVGVFVVAFILGVLALFAFSVFFVYAGITTIRREGLSLQNSLACIFAVGVWALLFGSVRLYLALADQLWAVSLAGLLVFIDIYVLFTFFCLMLYSFFYRIIPPGHRFDYVIVLGAGLMGDKPTPLLRDRLDTAFQAWDQGGRKAKFVVSGGQGSDEVVSEARAMADYLIGRGVPVSSILLEDRSTNTLENMRSSKKVIADDSRGASVRCVFVTNDFHVFRAGTYARKAGLVAEGIGCGTAPWYWCGAFVREYLALLVKPWVAPTVICILWLLMVFVSAMPC
jgi:uncharacterized SAM-binding protein YcdF (DUF218 family)